MLERIKSLGRKGSERFAQVGNDIRESALSTKETIAGLTGSCGKNARNAAAVVGFASTLGGVAIGCSRTGLDWDFYDSYAGGNGVGGMEQTGGFGGSGGNAEGGKGGSGGYGGGGNGGMSETGGAGGEGGSIGTCDTVILSFEGPQPKIIAPGTNNEAIFCLGINVPEGCPPVQTTEKLILHGEGDGFQFLSDITAHNDVQGPIGIVDVNQSTVEFGSYDMNPNIPYICVFADINPNAIPGSKFKMFLENPSGDIQFNTPYTKILPSTLIQGNTFEIDGPPAGQLQIEKDIAKPSQTVPVGEVVDVPFVITNAPQEDVLLSTIPLTLYGDCNLSSGLEILLLNKDGVALTKTFLQPEPGKSTHLAYFNMNPGWPQMSATKETWNIRFLPQCEPGQQIHVCLDEAWTDGLRAYGFTSDGSLTVNNHYTCTTVDQSTVTFQ